VNANDRDWAFPLALAMTIVAMMMGIFWWGELSDRADAQQRLDSYRTAVRACAQATSDPARFARCVKEATK